MMKGLFRTIVGLSLAGGLVLVGSFPAAAGELCPAGGALISAAVDSEKAVEWLDDEKRAYLTNEDGEWQVTTTSAASDKIAMVITAGYVYFGVADDRDDREADENRMTKAFGNKLKFLKEAVKKEIKAMWKAEAIDIDGRDVQAISDAVGLGTVSQDDRDWVLEAADCEAYTVNLDELD